MVKIMKLLRYFLGIALCSLCSCSEEDFTPNQQIVGLGGDEFEWTANDQWIYDNLTQPYNIDVKYRWDQSELDLNKMVVPVKEEVVVPVLRAVKKAFIDPYESEAGTTFVAKLTPKRYVLVGSPSYNTNGTITLGTAEGGRKIVLYRLNWYASGDATLLPEILRTCHHEFGHTMHQTKMYPTEYKSITPAGYTTSWNNTTDDDAVKLGFISPYSRSSSDEDFVEMIARILVYGREAFEERVAKAAAIYADPVQGAGLAYNPADALRQKESMVVDYMKNTWGIDFYDTDTRKGLVTLVQENLAELLANE